MTDKFAAMALAVDAVSRMTIIHPTTGRPLRDEAGADAYIDLLGRDSAKAQRFDHDRANDRLSRRVTATVTSEELEASEVDKLATLTVGWRLLGLDGKAVEVEFNEANARALYASAGMAWLRDQVVAFLANRANFSKASLKS